MAMTAEIVAVDQELALMLPEELRRQLGIGIGDEIEVEQTERGLRIVAVHRVEPPRDSAVKPPATRQRF